MEIFDVHVYEPGHTEPMSLPREDYVSAPAPGPLSAEDVVLEAQLRIRTGSNDPQRAVPVFRVPNSDTWLALTAQVHPDDMPADVFERVEASVQEHLAARHGQ